MANYQVLVTARSFGKPDPSPVQFLERGGCTLHRPSIAKPLTADELAQLVPGMDALIVGTDDVNAAVIRAGESLKVISRYGVGIDNIDLAEATARHVIVTNTPGTNDASVADLAMGLILTLSRHIPRVNGFVRAGKWDRITGMELPGKTLGLVGLGRIGKGVARRALGFDLKVVGYDPYPDTAWAEAHGVRLVSLDELITTADIISLHSPVTKETAGMFNARVFARMKPGSLLINTSRGELVDEEALYQALVSNHLAGAGLDVMIKEPPGDSPLVKLEQVVVTPHIGGNTVEAVLAMGTMAAENALAVLEGKLPRHIVNPEVTGPSR